MKWYWQIIWGLILPFIAGAALIVFENDLRNLSSAPSVVAEVQVGPWFVHPGSDVRKTEIGDFLEDQQRIADTQYPFAKLILRNESSQRVESIRFEMKDVSIEPDIVVLPNGKTADMQFYPGEFTSSPKSISLPSLDPGQEVTLFIYSRVNISVPYTFKNMALYTSIGRVPFQYLYYRSSLENDRGSWIEDWMPPIVFGVGALLIGFLALLVAGHDGYLKKLMESEDFYLRERIRFDANPKKFTPKFDEPPKQ